MSAAKNEHEIAERIVGWLTGRHPRGTAGVNGGPPPCFVCGSQLNFDFPAGEILIDQIEEIISEGLHS